VPGAGAPAPEPPLSPEKTAACLGRVAQDLDLRPDDPEFPWDLLPQLVTEQGLIGGLREAEQAGILPTGVDLARARRLYRLYENNVRAMMSYSPQPYPGRMTLFRSQAQPGTDADPSLGWSAVAVGGVAICTVPGDHFTMVREPHVRELAAQLHHRLQRVPRRRPGGR
jgi:hypothetical protein